MAAFSYLYIGLWAYAFWLRRTVSGEVLRVLVFVLALLEVVSPVGDTLLPTHQFSGALRFGLGLALFGTAFALVLHHRRLSARLRRQEAILSSMRVLLQEGVGERSEGAEAVHDLQKILAALVFGLEYGRKRSRLNATLMVRSGEGPFRILAQDHHADIDPAVAVDRDSSLAEKVADDRDTVGVIYVPNTRFTHGVRISPRRESPNQDYFRATEIIPRAFHSFDKSDPEFFKSVMCVRVPITEPGSDAVFCVSSQRANDIGSLELSAINLAAGLVAQVLKGARDNFT